MNDAGTVSVRFTTENAEAVRKALQDLGKDGEKALRQFDNSAKPANKSLLGLSDIVDTIRGKAAGLASQGGAIGTMLGRWGPAGLAAGAGLGAAYLILSKLIDAANEFAAKAQRVRDAAETFGLTTLQFQAYAEVASKVGLENEKVTQGFGKLARAIDDARLGEGKLLDEVRRVDPALADRLARTRDLADAIDIVAEAYNRASTAEQRAQIAGVMGKDSAFGLLLRQINAGGGSKILADQFKPDAIPTETIDRLSKLKVEIAQIKERTSNIWGEMFSENTLQHEKEVAEDTETIAKALKSIKDYVSSIDWSKVGAELTRQRLGLPKPPAPGTDLSQPLPGANPLGSPAGFGNRVDREGYSPRLPEPPTPEYVLKGLREQNALLGAAATPAEQLTLKIAELRVETANWSKNQSEANRGLAAFKQAQAEAAVATRQRLGIATEDEMLTRRLAELQDLRAKGFIKTAEEMAAAEARVRKEVHETANSIAVQNSTMPALTQLAQDAGDVNKQIDQGLAGWTRSAVSSFSIVGNATETLGEKVKRLGLSFVDMFLQIQMMKYVAAPIAKGFESFFTGLFPSAHGNVFSNGEIVPFARGGVITRPIVFPMARGMGLAGEAGEEGILPLRRGRNGNLGVEASGVGGNLQVHYSPVVSIDARGADASAADRISRAMQDDGRRFEQWAKSPAFRQAVFEASREANSRRWGD